MITLHIDITTASERKPFDPENIEDTIGEFIFDEAEDMAFFIANEILISEPKYPTGRVYVLTYGTDENGIVLVDHDDFNIVQNIVTQFKENLSYNENVANSNVYLFAFENYDYAYDMAKNFKEQTGMVWEWQKEGEPTIDNKGIKITSNAN